MDGVEPPTRVFLVSRSHYSLHTYELAKRYLEEHAKVKKMPTSTFRDERLLGRFILPTLGTRQIKTITRAEVAALQHKIGKETPAQANRTLRFFQDDDPGNPVGTVPG